MSYTRMEAVYDRLWWELGNKFSEAFSQEKSWVKMTFDEYETMMAYKSLIVTKQTLKAKWKIALSEGVFVPTGNPEIVVIEYKKLAEVTGHNPVPGDVCVRCVCQEGSE